MAKIPIDADASGYLKAINDAVDATIQLDESMKVLSKTSKDVFDSSGKLTGRITELVQQDENLAKSTIRIAEVMERGSLKIKDQTFILKDNTAARQKNLDLIAKQATETARLNELQAGVKGLAISTPVGVDLTKVAAYQRALNQVYTTAAKNNITTAELNTIWRQINSGGAIPTYIGQLGKAQAALLNLKSAQDKFAVSTVQNMEKVTKATQQFTVSWQTIQRMLTVHVGYLALGAISTGFREALTTAKEFEIRLAEIQTITQDAPLSTALWKKELLALSNAFGVPILEQVEGAYQAISNQVVNSSNAIAFMTEANKLALTTNATVAQSVDALSSVINAFGLQNEDTSKIAAVLFRTVDLGRVRLGEMADTLGRSAVTAGQLGVSYEELAAQITGLTIKGFPFEHAQTQILGLMQALLKPTTEMEKALKEWGFENGQAALKALGFIGVMKKMQEFTKGNLTVLAALVPRVRGLSEALALSGQGANEFIKTLDKLNQAEDYYEKAAEFAIKNVGRRLAVQQEQFKNAFIETASEMQRMFLLITENVIGFEKAGKAMALAIEVAMVPALAALLVGLRSIALFLVANPLTAAFAALAVGVTLAAKEFLKTGESIAEEWYQTWYAAFKKVEDVGTKTYSAQIKNLERAIAKSEKIIEQNTAEINKAISEEYEKFFKMVVKQGAKAGKELNAIDFDFVRAFKPILKRLKEDLDKSESDIKKYEKAIVNARDAIKELENTKERADFNAQIKWLTDVPNAKDIAAVNIELAKVLKQYEEIKLVNGDTLQIEERINNLIKLRHALLNDPLADERTQALQAEIDTLKSQNIEYLKQREELKKISGIIASGPEAERVKASKEGIANLTKRDTDIQKELNDLRSKGHTEEISERTRILNLELIQNARTRERLALSGQTDTVLKAQEKSLTEQVIAGEAIQAQLEDKQNQITAITQSTGKGQAATQEIARRETDSLIQAAKAREAAAEGDEEQLAKAFKRIRENQIAVAELTLTYKLSEAPLLKITELLAKQLELENKVQAAAKEKLKTAQEINEKTAQDNKTLEDAVEKVKDAKKFATAVNDVSKTPAERLKAFKEFSDGIDALSTRAESDTDFAEMLDRAIPLWPKMVTGAEELRAKMVETVEELKKQEELRAQLKEDNLRSLDIEAERAALAKKRLGEIDTTALDFKSLEASIIEKAPAVFEGILQSGDASRIKAIEGLKPPTLQERKNIGAFGTDAELGFGLTVPQLDRNAVATKVLKPIQDDLDKFLTAFKDTRTPIKDLTARYSKIVIDLETLGGSVSKTDKELGGLITGRAKTFQDLFGDQIALREKEVLLQKENETLKQQIADDTKRLALLTGENAAFLQQMYAQVSESTAKSAAATASAATSIETAAERLKGILGTGKPVDVTLQPQGKIPRHALGGKIEYFAHGGRKGTDTVPAMLTPGEFVINKKQTSIWLPLLELLNSGKLGTGSISNLLSMTTVGNLGKGIKGAMGQNPFTGLQSRFTSNFNNLFNKDFMRPFQYGGPVRPTIRGYADGGSVTNVGDVNVSMSSSGNPEIDVQRLGKLLQREIRRGTVRFV